MEDWTAWVFVSALYMRGQLRGLWSWADYDEWSWLHVEKFVRCRGVR
jgi:hypothetical protein